MIKNVYCSATTEVDSLKASQILIVMMTYRVIFSENTVNGNSRVKKTLSSRSLTN